MSFVMNMSTTRKGKHYSPDTEFKKGQSKPRNGYSFGEGKKHPKWKGDNASYNTIHTWIKNKFGKATRCENQQCVYPRKNSSYATILSPKRFEWANIDKKYSRDLSGWVQLCPSCHRKYDRGIISVEIDGVKYKLVD